MSGGLGCPVPTEGGGLWVSYGAVGRVGGASTLAPPCYPLPRSAWSVGALGVLVPLRCHLRGGREEPDAQLQRPPTQKWGRALPGPPPPDPALQPAALWGHPR